MIPLYILGMLLRFGPQHGYQIKKLIGEQLADFTDIKLPTIYYHLEKMEAAGYIEAESVKDGSRPEKMVYHISETGKDHFKQLLYRTLNISYRPSFEVDSALFFSDSIDRGDFLAALEQHIGKLNASLARIDEHKKETLPFLPHDMRISANLIFEHHIRHYQAEIGWAEQAISNIKEEKNHDESQSH